MKYRKPNGMIAELNPASELSTNCFDKNNTEIFVNDIIKGFKGELFVVDMHNEKDTISGFYLVSQKDSFRHQLNTKLKNAEIIGNIRDNKEILQDAPID